MFRSSRNLQGRFSFICEHQYFADSRPYCGIHLRWPHMSGLFLSLKGVEIVQSYPLEMFFPPMECWLSVRYIIWGAFISVRGCMNTTSWLDCLWAYTTSYRQFCTLKYLLSFCKITLWFEAIFPSSWIPAFKIGTIVSKTSSASSTSNPIKKPKPASGGGCCGAGSVCHEIDFQHKVGS